MSSQKTETERDVDLVFQAIVLPKILYDLPIYGAYKADLETFHCF